MDKSAKVSVLFVCMGNICRSPTAQGVFASLVDQEELAGYIEVDSAGTCAYHVGKPPDERAWSAALKRGIDLGAQSARRVDVTDFAAFDYVLAMDRDNYKELKEICPPEHAGKLRLFLDFAPALGIREVPDPYYGGVTGFERVLDLVEEASRGLLADIRRQYRI